MVDDETERFEKLMTAIVAIVVNDSVANGLPWWAAELCRKLDDLEADVTAFIEEGKSR
jgi:hypothetical protein